MKLLDWLLGRPLSNQESEQNKVTVWAGIPILGLDALSSAAYGPEAALTILLPLGAIGLTQILPIIGVIVALLAILYFSYRQTIHAYPNGGGSYIVASANLGPRAGLFAAAALMIDYILTVAVGISAGVGALVSAVPSLHHHTLGLCLGILGFITLVNLRGVRESGVAFGIPTYAFIVSLLGVLGLGIVKAVLAGGHPVPVEQPPILPAATMVAAPWLLMRSFASGCTAMTGVEAVSNGIQAFAKPGVQRAQQTLTAIVAILAVLLLAIAYLCKAYTLGATDPDASNYQSVLSQMVAAIVGRGSLYYFTIFSVIAVLALSANTGFADFPRLCHLIAEDDYMPHLFAIRGRRLVYSVGICVLALACAILLIAFKGVTDRLIPLYAIGAFLAFTLSQAGMVQHWLKNRGGGWRASLAVNLVGTLCTGIALGVVLVAKFVEGAWITVVLIPCLVTLFSAINRHYRWVKSQVSDDGAAITEAPAPPIVLVPIKAWNRISADGIAFALSLSQDVTALHVVSDEEDPEAIRQEWERVVAAPRRAAGDSLVELSVVASPFRRFIRPVLDEVQRLKQAHPGRRIAVIVPELVETNVLTWPLHNQRANALKAALLFAAERRVVVISVPWYLTPSS